MAGNTFNTGGDVADGVYSQSGFSTTTTTEDYALGTRRVQLADEVASGLTQATAAGTILTGDEADRGNSGVDRTKNFALLEGDREWMYIKCATAQIKVGDVVIRDSATPFIGQTCAADAKTKPALLGVADNVIAVGSYGWVITKGCAVVRTDTSGTKVVAVNALIDTDGSSGAAGEVATAAGTDLSVIGVTLEAAGTTLVDFAQCYVDIS